MFRRFLTYCLLLLPVCMVMADGVDHLGSVRRAATPLLLYSIEICYCSKEFGSLGVFSLRIVRQDGVVERTNHYYPYGGLHGGSIMKFSCFSCFSLFPDYLFFLNI